MGDEKREGIEERRGKVGGHLLAMLLPSSMEDKGRREGRVEEAAGGFWRANEAIVPLLRLEERLHPPDQKRGFSPYFSLFFFFFEVLSDEVGNRLTSTKNLKKNSEVGNLPIPLDKTQRRHETKASIRRAKPLLWPWQPC